MNRKEWTAHPLSRGGAMRSRHTEISAEALRFGMLPTSLKDKQVLDVGCWSGGDLLVLAGLAGQVTAIEEHPIAAQAAQRLVALLGLNTPVLETSCTPIHRSGKGNLITLIAPE